MELVDTPRERLKTVTLGLLAHKSGPNVVAGIALGALLQTIAGMTPWWWPILTGAVWVAWILVYAVADEIQQLLEKKRRERDNPWILDTVDAPYGIE